MSFLNKFTFVYPSALLIIFYSYFVYNYWSRSFLKLHYVGFSSSLLFMRTVVRNTLDFVGIICTPGSQWLRKNEAGRDLTLDITTTGISRRPLPSWRPFPTSLFPSSRLTAHLESQFTINFVSFRSIYPMIGKWSR